MGAKFSKILDSLIKIQSLDLPSSSRDLQNFISNVDKYVRDLHVVNHDNLNKAKINLLHALQEYSGIFEETKKKLEDTIYSSKKEYLNQSEEIYKQNIEQMLFEEELEWAKLWPPSKDDFNYFYHAINNYTNWQYGGLIVGAKNSNIMNAVTGTEPFYMMEKFPDYSSLLAKKLHPDFMRKIKFYQLENIKKLPDNSMGIIVVFNEFNFLPWSITPHILNTLAKKLISGGTLIFNYNNCNTVRGFINFENNQMVYSTPQMYEQFLKNLNLSCIERYDSLSESFSFLVFKKDGSKKLIKSYPSVGFIKEQPTLSNPAAHQKRIAKIRNLVKSKNTY